jgi:titin
MKDVRDSGNVDESRFPSYTQWRRPRRWLRALAGICLAFTVVGGSTMVAGGIASAASAHVLAPNKPCSVPSAAAADQWFCLKADVGISDEGSQVQLTWNPPATANPVTVYTGDAQGNGQPAVVINPTDKSAVVPGLKTDTTYHFWLDVGEIRMSDIVSATPTEQVTVPGAPVGLAATAGDGQVSLSWGAPVRNGGSEASGYKVSVATSPDFRGAKAYGVEKAVFVSRDLVNGTMYYFRVTAVNDHGEGQASCAVPATPVGAPGAPAGLTAAAGDGQVTLSWTAPASDGGSPVTGYRVYKGTSPGGETGPVNGSSLVTSPYTVTDLANGTPYYFTVTAVNKAGEGKPSDEVPATPVAVPGAPAGLTAAAGDGQVTLSWTAPASDGGSPVTGYRVYKGTSPGGETGPVNGSSLVTSPYTVTDLANGTPYYFTVTAVNKAGEGKPSDEVPATPVAVPGAPAGLTAAAGDGQVTLSWTAPASDGGSPVTGYRVYKGTSPGGETGPVNGSSLVTSPYTVTDLANGTPYYFTVTAVNKAGEGKPSDEVPATPVAVPGAPAGLTAAAGDGQVTLSWTAPASDGGSPVTGYRVYKGTSPGGETGPVNGSALVTATGYKVTGLVNGTTYYFRVTAVNKAGEGKPSVEAKAVPVRCAGGACRADRGRG